ncbi:MAG TPA: protein kinase [Kofleriaceae bacterium]|nr:protein kinase [Kofleriaceae bacterium]
MHRTRVPRTRGAINVIVQVLEGPTETVIDVVTAPEEAHDNEATQIRQPLLDRATDVSPPPIVDAQSRPRREPTRPPQDAPVHFGPGGRVGRYEIRDKIGQGAFGFVFIARDTNLERDVALKILNPSHVTNAEITQRFLQEARAAARIAHPGIITMLECGQVTTSIASTAYIAMELLQGETLTSRLKRSGKLRPDIAVEMTRQIACALDAAHRANVLHRDLKPDNIHIVPDPAHASGERVKILDFGLAKVTHNNMTNAQSVFGTPRYMSPEQCRSSGQIDQRSDIYSLGCILFELVCGRPPFDGELRETIKQHLHTTAPRARLYSPEIAPELDELISRMLAKDVNERPQTMSAVQTVLQRVGAMSPGAAETMLPVAAQLMAFQQHQRQHAAIPAVQPVPPSGPRAQPSGRAPAPSAEPRGPNTFRYAAIGALLVIAGAVAMVTRGGSDSPSAPEPTTTAQPPGQPPVVLVGQP